MENYSIAVDSENYLDSFSCAQKGAAQRFKLLEMQKAYFVGRSAVYGDEAHIYFEFDIESFNLERFQKSWQHLFERHEVLRCVFYPEGLQEVLPLPLKISIPVLNLTSLKDDEQFLSLEETRNELSQRQYKLDQLPFFDLRVSLLPKDKARIHLDFSLMLIDGMSVSILMSELARLYYDPECCLSPVSFSYSDYLQASQTSSEYFNKEKSRKYWKNCITLLPQAPDLPLLTKTSSKQGMKRRTFYLPVKDWTSFLSQSSSKELTPSMALCAAYAEVIRYWSRKPDFLLNMMLSNRKPIHKDVNGIVGNFSSLQMLAVEVADSYSFTERAKSLQKQFFKDREYHTFTGIDVLKELNKNNKSNFSAAAPVVFSSNLHINKHSSGNNDMGAFAIYGDNWGDSHLQTPQVWLDLSVSEHPDGGLVVQWDSRDELFPNGLMKVMAETYFQLLSRLATNCKLWDVSDLELAPLKQVTLRERVNETATPLLHSLLHEPFFNSFTNYSNESAVLGVGYELSYDDLASHALDIAHKLQSRCVKPNQLIAVVMQKGWEQIVAVMGIQAAGAAYLPIDPSLPSERLHYLIKNADVKIVLTTNKSADRFDWPENVECIFISNTIPQSKPSKNTPEIDTKLNDLAYVIFTSGSTGTPKGVMIDHLGAVNTVLDINQRFQVASKDRIFAISALNFDLSVWDIFGSLSVGAALVMPAPDKTSDPGHWLTLMNQHSVTIWNSAPPVMQILVDYAEARGRQLPKSLRLVMMSGDWIPTTLPDRIRRLCVNDVQIISLGGATEASIWSVMYPIGIVNPEWRSIPYGKPMANQQLYVLDGALRQCPDWVTGKLYIGGIGVAKGYWKDPAKTDASFIHHSVTGERLYCTGDLGRYLPDGNIEFLGREDNQIKLRGYRIELGEIESILSLHDDIEIAVVSVSEMAAEKVLVAYVTLVREVKVLNPLADVIGNKLRGFLSEKLPSYMVPTQFVILEIMPLTSNGKLDRKSMPKLDEINFTRKETNFIAPRNKTEHRLSQIWLDILAINKVSVLDNFFNLGGQSFSAVRMMARIQQEFNVDLPLSTLLQNGTIEHLAQCLDENKITDDHSLVCLQQGKSRTPVYFVHAAGGNVLCYQELAKQLSDDVPFYAFQAQGLTQGMDALNRIESMAKQYIKSIPGIHKQDTVILGGWSSGGVVAYEMARQLQLQGTKVESVIMIDSPAPLENDLISEQRAVGWFATDLYAGSAPPVIQDKGLSPQKYLHAVIKARLHQTGNDEKMVSESLYRAFSVFKANLIALRQYRPAPFDVSVQLFKAAGDPIEEFLSHPSLEEKEWGWSSLVNGDLNCSSLEGDHYELLTGNSVKKLASTILEKVVPLK